jgi:thymidylate synthase (FAD)
VYDSELCKQIFEKSINESVARYDCLLKMNVAPELARCVLPQSMYTEFIETGSLAAYARLYKLRTTSDAQREIQWYANEIGKQLEEKFPISWKALTSSSE